MRKVDPIQIVEAGYDRIAQRYHDQRDRFKHQNHLHRFLQCLPHKACVLDVGCGSGVPVTRSLVDAGCRVTAIDLSTSMLALARVHVPEARLVKMNMISLDFEPDSFDGLSCCYALFHVPRTLHRSILSRFYRVVKSGGVMLLSAGYSDWEGVEDFHGSEMYWSHYGWQETRGLIEQVGFRLRDSEVVEQAGERHYWVLAAKEST